MRIAQTPAPKKDRIYGSKLNKPNSASSKSKAKSIKLSESVITSIKSIIEGTGISLATAKAVVRRGMGAYSKSHRPTIKGGKPNSRVAWGLARLNAFVYKAEHGKSKSGKYTQDDDLLRESGFNVKKYHLGGDMSKHLAPNGKPSNLTHEQWHLVRTPEFKAWFGDWENDPENASKVVDKNGEPLVVYHGTKDNRFTIFDKNKIGSSSPLKDKKGFFFTSLEEEAENYKSNYYHGGIFNMFLSIKNPYIYDKSKSDSYDSGIYWWDLKHKEFLLNSINNDGVIVYSTESNLFVAFEPNQIKLADGTNTTFDGRNPDIRYEDGGIVDITEWKTKEPELFECLLTIRALVEANAVVKDSFIDTHNNLYVIKYEDSNPYFDSIITETCKTLAECKDYLEVGEVEVTDMFVLVPLVKNPDNRYEEDANIACVDFINKTKSIFNNGYYHDFGNFVLISYNSGGQKELNVYQTINPLLAKEMSELLSIADSDCLKLIYHFYDEARRLDSKNILNELKGKHIIVANRDSVECSTFNRSNLDSRYNEEERELAKIKEKYDADYNYFESEIYGQPYKIRMNKNHPRNPRNDDDFLHNLSLINVKYPSAKVIRESNNGKLQWQYDEITDWEDAKSEIENFFNEIKDRSDSYKSGGSVSTDLYEKWKSLVNMSASELKQFMATKDGKEAGLTKGEADELGIKSGHESAKWILKMKATDVSKWTPTMWEWAKRQVSFISRMRGNRGGLYDQDGNKTRKHTSLLIWGHNPEQFNGGGEIDQNTSLTELAMDIEKDHRQTFNKIKLAEKYLSSGNYKLARKIILGDNVKMLLNHFSEEEKFVFPKIRNNSNQYLIDTIIEQHIKFEKLFQKAENEPDNNLIIAQIIVLLKSHMTKEYELIKHLI